MARHEVEDLRPPLAGHHDVFRLQVAVRDPGRVRRRQSVGDLGRNVDGFSKAEARAPEGFPVHQLGNEIVLPDVVEGDDVGMVERGDRAGFLLEAPAAIGVGGELRRQGLQGHLPAEPRVARPVHLAHAARAEKAKDFVRPEHRAGGQVHGFCDYNPSRRRGTSLQLSSEREDCWAAVGDMICYVWEYKWRAAAHDLSISTRTRIGASRAKPGPPALP